MALMMASYMVLLKVNDGFFDGFLDGFLDGFIHGFFVGLCNGSYDGFLQGSFEKVNICTFRQKHEKIITHFDTKVIIFT